MRVLITGAAGFVAGHLIDFLLREEPAAQVLGVVRPHGTPGGRARRRVSFAEADLEEPAAVEAVFDLMPPDRIVHLAAQSSVHHSFADPAGTLRTNVLPLVHLLEAVRRRGLRPRVLAAGSADEYGLVRPEDVPVTESLALRPASPYAVSKATQTFLALQYAQAHGLGVLATRTFPHTGPGRGEVFAESSFARQVAAVEAGLLPPVLHVGNLDVVRDFTDVRDVVRAYWLLLDKGEAGEVYNVCRGTGVRLREVLDTLIRLAGAQVELRQDPARLRPSDAPILVGDPGKLRRATGWVPRLPLETTLKDLLDHWRARLAPAGQAAPPERRRT
jgi:GDP-4-dehydro-6-deoxy-D-mannose reductase